MDFCFHIGQPSNLLVLNAFSLAMAKKYRSQLVYCSCQQTLPEKNACSSLHELYFEFHFQTSSINSVKELQLPLLIFPALPKTC